MRPLWAAHPGRSVDAVSPERDDLADSPVVDLLDCFLRGLAVPGHQAAGDFEVLLRGLFTRLEHAMKARRVDGERLFHEDVAAFIHGVFDMHGAESGRGGQQDHVARIERVDGLLVGIHADELPLRGHVDLLGLPVSGSRGFFPRGVHLVVPYFAAGVGEIFREIFQAPFDAIGKDVGHGPQFRGAVGAQGVQGGAGASSAATHQGDLDGVVFAGIGPGGKAAGQGCGRQALPDCWRKLRRVDLLFCMGVSFKAGVSLPSHSGSGVGG